MNTTLYNVKMRAAKNQRHISGAERIVSYYEMQTAMAQLTQRAMRHPHGEPDSLSITMNAIAGPVCAIPALPVFEPQSAAPDDAKKLLEAELSALGVDHRRLLELFYSLSHMRGAALVHVGSLERMEPDPNRGVRATCMDYLGDHEEEKNHKKEALCLASKVAHCPFIVGELCMSDDPDYTTGYFASLKRGYVRLAKIKEPGDPRGGRIFLFTGSHDNVKECIHYLEQTPILVDLS